MLESLVVPAMRTPYVLSPVPAIEQYLRLGAHALPRRVSTRASSPDSVALCPHRPPCLGLSRDPRAPASPVPASPRGQPRRAVSETPPSPGQSMPSMPEKRRVRRGPPSSPRVCALTPCAQKKPGAMMLELSRAERPAKTLVPYMSPRSPHSPGRPPLSPRSDASSSLSPPLSPPSIAGSVADDATPDTRHKEGKLKD